MRFAVLLAFVWASPKPTKGNDSPWNPHISGRRSQRSAFPSFFPLLMGINAQSGQFVMVSPVMFFQALRMAFWLVTP